MRQMQWFRFYYEARTDAKLRSLPDDEFRIWLNLLCYAAEQDDERGAFDASDRFLIALECSGGDEELLSRTVTRLSRLRIIDDTGEIIRFINFEKRQYDKPSDTPAQTRERKRKQRAMTRDSDEQPPSSRDVTPRHAERREEENREDTEKSRGEKNDDAHAREASNPAPGKAKALAKAETPPFEYIVALCEAAGVDVAELSRSEREKQCAVAKRLRADGITPDDVLACVRWLLSQSWRSGGVTLFTVEKEYGGWVLIGRPAIAQSKPANGRASPKPSNADISAANIDAAFDDGPYIETTGRIAS